MKKIGIAVIRNFLSLAYLRLKQLTVDVADKSLQFFTQSVSRACFAFPDDGNTPPLAYQVAYADFIAFSVLSQFAHPKFSSRFRNTCPLAPVMLMPEASVNEDGQSEFRQDDIWSSRQILAVQTESKPHGMKLFPDKDFWFSILRLDFCHHPASLGGDRRISAVPHLRSLLDVEHTSTAGRNYAAMVTV